LADVDLVDGEVVTPLGVDDGVPGSDGNRNGLSITSKEKKYR